MNQEEANKKEISKEIKIIDKMEFQGNLIEIHHSKRISLKSELHSIENKQAQIWHQRSRQN